MNWVELSWIELEELEELRKKMHFHKPNFLKAASNVNPRVGLFLALELKSLTLVRSNLRSAPTSTGSDDTPKCIRESNGQKSEKMK